MPLSPVGRVERYSDPSQVIVVTGLPFCLQTTGAWLGVDVNFRSNDLYVVSSLALTF
jgi:hypothetical protein